MICAPASGRLARGIWLVLLLLPAAAGGCTAERLAIPNFHVVEEGVLLRGGQPTAGGLQALRDEHGVRTIINLNDRTIEAEREEAEKLGIEYVALPMNVYLIRGSQLVQFLSAVRAARAQGNTPIYVHCLRGQDRTGTAVGVYRIVENGWSVDQAAAELDRYQHWTHAMMFPHLRRHLHSADAWRTRWREAAATRAAPLLESAVPASSAQN